MHRISRIRVTNYRSVRDSEFHLDSYTPLVGYNNAGKSNILRALQWVVESPTLSTEDFNDPDHEVIVEATISGITGDVLNGLAKKHKDKVVDYIVDGEFTIRKTQAEPGLPKTKITLDILSNSNGEKKWTPNPAGIKEAFTALFPEVIFVGAMEDSAVDVGKNAAGTTIGKLIKEIVGPIREDYEARIAEALAPIRKNLSSDGEDKDQRLKDVDAVIGSHLGNFFPDVVALTHIEMPKFDDFSKRATLKVKEKRYGDDRENDAAAMGHGAQRSIQISLINALSTIRRANDAQAARTALLLVDEPELYLHPQAIAVARAALKKLSTKGYQIAFSTHSGELIGYDDAEKTLIVRRSSEKGTTTENSLAQNIAKVVGCAGAQAELLFELSNSREFLFCDRVLLVEGKTERYLLPRIYEYHHGRSLAEDRVGIVRVDSSSNLPNSKRILESMGIECRCIADLDFLLKDGPKNALVGLEDRRRQDILAVVGPLADDHTIAIGNDGWPQKGQGKTAAQAFELIAANEIAGPLIGDLVAEAQEHGYFIWSRGTIETHLGLVGKKPPIWQEFVRKIRAGAVDDVPDLDGVCKAISF